MLFLFHKMSGSSQKEANDHDGCVIDWESKPFVQERGYSGLSDQTNENGSIVVDVVSKETSAYAIRLYFQRDLHPKESKHVVHGEFEYCVHKGGKNESVILEFQTIALKSKDSKMFGAVILINDKFKFPKCEQAKYKIRTRYKTDEKQSLGSLLQASETFDFYLTGLDPEEKVPIHKLVAETTLEPVKMRSAMKMKLEDSDSNVFHLGIGKKESLQFVVDFIYQGCTPQAPKDLIDAFLVGELLMYEPVKKVLKQRIVEQIRDGVIPLRQAENVRKQFKDIREFTTATCLAAAKNPQEYIQIREGALMLKK